MIMKKFLLLSLVVLTMVSASAAPKLSRVNPNADKATAVQVQKVNTSKAICDAAATMTLGPVSADKAVSLKGKSSKRIDLGRTRSLRHRTPLKDEEPVEEEELYAFYYTPWGTLYSGLSNDFYSLTSTWMLLPPFTDVTWFNASSEDAIGCNWQYIDPDGEEDESGLLVDVAETTDEDLTLQYGLFYAYEMNPILTVEAGEESVEYQDYYPAYTEFGGDFDLTDYSAARNFGATNWRAIEDGEGYTLANWGFGIGYDEQKWNVIFGDETTEARCSGVGQLFPYSGHPIFLKGTWIYAVWESRSDCELTAHVYPIDEEGYLGEEVATATTLIPAQEWDSGMIEFQFETIDPITQLPVEAELTLDSGFMVYIDWDPDAADAAGLSYLTFLPNSEPVADGDTYGYFSIETTSLETGKVENAIYPTDALTSSYGICYLSFCMMIDAGYTELYPFFEPEDANIDADPAGETREFQFYATEPAEQMYVEEDEAGEMPEWVSYAIEDVYGERAESRLKEESYLYTNFAITIDALPESTDYRETTLTLRQPGDYQVFTITQGEETGVTIVRKDSGIKVSTEGESFIITAPAAVNSVRIFNAAGQLVKTAAINGTATVNVADLASGIYMLRFNNKAVVKAVK